MRAAELVRLVPGARAIVLKDVGHLAPWHDPAAFNRAVLAFLRL
jgi:pimeloyl-ACP methyl ester carboxylesterase